MQPTKSQTPAGPNSIGNESPTANTDQRLGRPSSSFSVRPSHSRRSSQSSFLSEPSSNAPVSCVSRGNVTGEDCARQRFIIWAAVRRNKSTRMAMSERLRCPLIRCGESFDGHEEMLGHLMQCQHLSTGEYLCYECMKVERFNDKKCTCCLKQPTTRRRIINMAKHFFSNIGNTKVRRENHNTFTHSIRSCTPSIDLQPEFGREQIETPLPWDGNEGSIRASEPKQPRFELNGTELPELDSRPLTPAAELDTVNTTMPPPSTPMTRTKASIPSSRPNVSEPKRSLYFQTTAQSSVQASGSGGRRPSLALNTKIDHYGTRLGTAHLSSSASLRTSPHGISPITPWSASSKSSTVFSMVSGGNTMLASPITPLSADAGLMATQESHLFNTEKDIDMFACPDIPDRYTPGDLSTSTCDNHVPFEIPRLLPDSLIPSYDPEDSYSWLSSINSEISLAPSINMVFTDLNTKNVVPSNFLESHVPSSGAKLLVEQIWDALGEHLSNSVSKLSRLQHNPLAVDLMAQPTRTVASLGLARLRKMLSSVYVSGQDPLEYLCFIHLIYSMSLVLRQDSLNIRSIELYEQAMAYGALFDSTSRDNYYQIVSTIWHQSPQYSVSRGRFGDPISGNKGKEPDYHSSSTAITKPDPLLVAGQSFLDELEILVVNNSQQRLEVLHSQIWSSHFASEQPTSQGPTPFTIASSFLVQDLCRAYHDSEHLLQKLKEIARSASVGYYNTIRRLELELVQTGKNYIPTADAQDQYIFQVRNLCDQIYVQSGTKTRAEYYLLGIALVEDVIRSVAREPQQSHEGHPDYALMPYSYGDEFIPDLNMNKFSWYPMVPSTQQGISSGVVASYTPRLDIPTIHPVTPQAQRNTDSPNTLPPRSDASATPSETYTVSPGNLSDVPLDARSNPYQPTPPPQVRRELGETSSTSPLASSGQKIEANERCDICGYRPKGDPQWFKGSMAKHKKMQHSSNPPVIYKCQYPGCNSEYKNRRDNLRQHQIEKNHFTGDEATQRANKRKRR